MPYEKSEQTLPLTPEIIEKKVSLCRQIYELEQQDPADRTPLHKLYKESFALDKRYDFSDTAFEENGKYGVKDITGAILVPAIYTDVRPQFIYEYNNPGAIPVADESGKFALVMADGKGTPITPFVYEDIGSLEYTSWYVALKDKKMAVYTSKGKEIVPCIIDRFTCFGNEMYSFSADGKEGLFTLHGLYVPPIYDLVTGDNFVRVQKGTQCGYIDTEGRFYDEDDEASETADLLGWCDID